MTSTRKAKTGRQAEDLAPNHAEQAVLRRIIEGDLSGLSDNEIARRLNAAGIAAKKGGKWFGATVANLKARAHLADPKPATLAA